MAPTPTWIKVLRVLVLLGIPGIAIRTWEVWEQSQAERDESLAMILILLACLHLLWRAPYKPWRAWEWPAVMPCGHRRLPVHSGRRRARFRTSNFHRKLDRERLLVTGPNGSGKTTLLEVLSGERKPDVGEVIADRARLGVIAQGGVDWMLDESLLELVESGDRAIDIETLTRYRFPLALAERPLRSLSPGERVRAALIALLQRSPTVEALVLDEPTYSLDLVGQKAMRELLAAWPGGLIVASHDEDLLEALRGPGVAEIDLSSSTRSL